MRGRRTRCRCPPPPRRLFRTPRRRAAPSGSGDGAGPALPRRGGRAADARRQGGAAGGHRSSRAQGVEPARAHAAPRAARRTRRCGRGCRGRARGAGISRRRGLCPLVGPGRGQIRITSVAGGASRAIAVPSATASGTSPASASAVRARREQAAASARTANTPARVTRSRGIARASSDDQANSPSARLCCTRAASRGQPVGYASVVAPACPCRQPPRCSSSPSSSTNFAVNACRSPGLRLVIRVKDRKPAKNP